MNDMTTDWSVTPDDLSIEARKPGISGFMRLKNEETYLDLAIESHLHYLDELILVYNQCTDSTPEICRKWEQDYPDKIKVYEYEPYVYPVGAQEAKSLKSSDERTLANFYNYSLCKTTRRIAIKVDGDHIAVPAVFSEAVRRSRSLKEDECLSLRGANLFECGGSLYISNGYNYCLKPGKQRSNGAPPLTTGDHAFFPVSRRTWHEMDIVEGYEVLDLALIFSLKHWHFPLAFLHMKGVKADRGMSNWDLNRYKDSSRQDWSKAVLKTKESDLLTVDEAKLIYKGYFTKYPYELLESSGIHLPYKKARWWRLFKARCMHRVLKAKRAL